MSLRDLRRAFKPDPGTSLRHPTLRKSDDGRWYLVDQGRRVYLGPATIASGVTSEASESFDIPSWANVLDVTVSRRHGGSGFQSVFLRFNSDGGSNYQRYLRVTEHASGGATSGLDSESLTASGIFIGFLPSGTAEGSMTARIADVNRAERSTVHVLGGYARVGNDHRTWIGGGRWSTQAAITSVAVHLGGTDSFAAARITLVGYPDTA